MRRRRVLAGGTALLSVPLAGCGHPSVVLDFDEATDDGSATRRGRYELFDRTKSVRVDGAVYEVDETRVASSEVTVYEDLPETDRRRLDGILSQSELPTGSETGTCSRSRGSPRPSAPSSRRRPTAGTSRTTRRSGRWSTGSESARGPNTSRTSSGSPGREPSLSVR